MGVCFSKNGTDSSATKSPSKAPPEKNGLVNEEMKKPELAEKTPVSTVKNETRIVEKKDAEETHVKNIIQHEDEGRKVPGTIAGPLRASSCTKEEVDAILIQCGRLSRNSSGKVSSEKQGSGLHKRRSGSKGSRDLDDERKEEGNEIFKGESRPSPSRRTASRERSGSRERGSSGGRRVSRSPGRRSDGPPSASSGCDKPRQQLTKMVTVPATEKSALIGADCATLGAERVSIAAHLSSSSPSPSDQSSNERNPMTEINENSLRSGEEKRIQTFIIHQAEKPDMEETMEGTVNGDLDNLKQRTLNRTRSRSSRRSSHDLDNNTELNWSTYTAILVKDIKSKEHHHRHHQHQNAVFSFPTYVTKACSIVQAVTDPNSTFSEQRSYGTEIVTESKLEFKDDVEPQESTGSNSVVEEPCTVPLDLNSVNSPDGCPGSSSGIGKTEDLESEVIPVGTKQQKRTWTEPGHGQRSITSSSINSLTEATIKAATTPSGKKKLNRRPFQHVR